ncbi:MAG: cytochrome c3 family protein [Thermoanaerobaculia bacterium]
MTARRLAVLVLTLAVAPLALYAADDPHGLSFNTGCLSCHATHKAAGGSLTNAISNESLCTSCHNLGGTAANFPLERFYKADPVNRLGASHAWNAPATNANAGAAPPANAALSSRLSGGNIICSTCHDQHRGGVPAAITAGDAGAQHVTAPVRILGSGTGTISVVSPVAANATSKAYVMEIIETGGAAGTAKFRLSNDGGVSWFGYDGAAWTAYVTGNARLTGSNIALNDGTNVSVTFTGSFTLGDRYRFYVAYPFLRAALDSGDNVTGTKFCRDCHADRAMDHNSVRTYDGAMKSHPVGVALNANGGGYDRATPLDANGLVQGGAGDGNPTNDLTLAGSTVQCLTCHGIHHADSNTQTPDNP